MKWTISLLIISSFCFTLSGQESEWPDLDASTLDVVYYPQEVAWRNYLNEDKREISPKIKLVYSRPLKKGRQIFGRLLSYGGEWRLGANEATSITFYGPVGIADATLQGGTYTMSAVIEKNHWTINFSTESGIWGSANRDQDLTVASIRYTVEMVDSKREDLAMTFQEIDEHNVNLVIEWDGHRVTIPIALNPVVFGNPDPSPLDMAHYPRNSAFTNYAEGDDKNITPKIQVTYSRPQKKGREIFGNLLEYGKVWRLGANEATEIALFQDVSINGTSISRGRYALFAVPGASTWDFIFSKDYPIWGAHDREESKDVATITVPSSAADEVIEALTIIFEEKSNTQVDMKIGWDQTRVTVPFVIEE